MHPFPSILVTVVAAVLVAVAGGDRTTIVVVAVGMLCYQFCIGLTNDVIDAPADANDKPWKPIPAGVLSLQAAIRAAVFVGGAALLVTLLLPLGAWAIGAAGLACGLLYNAWLKRTVLSWLPLSIALPLVPAWAYRAAGEWDDLLWWAFPLGALLGLGLHLANQAPDVDPAAPGESGLAGMLGARASYAIAVTCFGLAGTAAAAVLLSRDETRAVYVAALVTAVAITSLRARALFGRQALFALLAVGTGALSLLFISVAE